MEPWGVPQVREASKDEATLMITENVMLDKYDLNQSKAAFLTPAHFSKQIHQKCMISSITP